MRKYEKGGFAMKRATLPYAEASNPDDLNLLRKKQVAKHLGVSTACIDLWRRKGRFPRPVWLSEKSCAWRVTDIKIWLAERQQKATGR
jgi:predicted DNA-binding transcriptional regulator AlpA